MSGNAAPGSPGEWLLRARGKLALARQPLPPGAFREDLCFMAQQAAELAVKAVYQQQGWQFPFVHDLERLLGGLTDRGLPLPDRVAEADELTLYATQTRYPGTAGPVREQDHRRAIQIAEAVVAWAETIVT